MASITSVLMLWDVYGIYFSILIWIAYRKESKFIDKTCRVYDLEIQDYHNFALAAGVFVHNSKDISDSVAGAIWNCSNSNNVLNMTRLTQQILNPNMGTLRAYSEQELKSMEMMEFETMRNKLGNGIFRGL